METVVDIVVVGIVFDIAVWVALVFGVVDTVAVTLLGTAVWVGLA